jgi:hypothetical protein
MVLTPGTPVEVNQVWAAASPAPLRAWVKGYTLDRIEGETAFVVHSRGLYHGITARYPLRDVRPSRICPSPSAIHNCGEPFNHTEPFNTCDQTRTSKPTAYRFGCISGYLPADVCSALIGKVTI